jgi:hypothetical protein
MSEQQKDIAAKKQTKIAQMIVDINSQALTIKAIMELLNITDEQIRQKCVEIIEKLKASGPYDDDDEDYDDDSFDDEDYDDDDFDDDDSFDEDDFDDDEDGYDFQSDVKSSLNKSGITYHPAGAFIFGG